MLVPLNVLLKMKFISNEKWFEAAGSALPFQVIVAVVRLHHIFKDLCLYTLPYRVKRLPIVQPQYILDLPFYLMKSTKDHMGH